MVYDAKTRLKKPKKVFWLISAAVLLIGSYTVYALYFNNISYLPSYQSKKVAKYSAPSIDLGPYPASVRLLNQDIEYHNSKDKLPMASTVKLITALSLEDKIGVDNLNKTITLGAKEIAITQSYVNKGGSVVRFNSGYKLSYQQALEYLLVVSANNFADILVNSQFANQQEYIDYANDWLVKKGLKDTVVYDASGFAPQTITTPSDLTKLGVLALQSKPISAIVNQKSVSLPNGQSKPSTNLFFDSTYGNLTGIKTGNTDEAKFVFVTSIESVDKPTIVSSVMQAPNRAISQQQAIDNADKLGKTYTNQELFANNSTVLSVNLPWQNEVAIITKEPVSLNNIANQKINYSFNLDTITKNSRAGQKIGTMNASSVLDQKSFDIYLSAEYDSISPFWLLTHPLN